MADAAPTPDVLAADLPTFLNYSYQLVRPTYPRHIGALTKVEVAYDEGLRPMPSKLRAISK